MLHHNWTYSDILVNILVIFPKLTQEILGPWHHDIPWHPPGAFGRLPRPESRRGCQGRRRGARHPVDEPVESGEKWRIYHLLMTNIAIENGHL